MEQSKKRAREDFGLDRSDVDLAGNVEMEDEDDELLKLVEGVEEGLDNIEPLMDDKSVKKLILTFERANSKNQNDREQHPKDPSKWIDSEVALDEALRALHVLGSTPTLFPVLVELSAHESLVALLAHANVDMGTAAVACLAELLEGSDDPRESRFVEALAGELAETGAVAAALIHWERLQKEQEKSEGVQEIMSFLERMMENDPETAEALLKDDRFFALCCASISPAPGAEYGDAELSVSEVLSAAVLSAARSLDDAEQTEQKKKKAQQIMDSLLIVLHRKGRTSAASSVETEVVSNVANAVANMLSVPRFAEAFAACEGVQLVIKMIESKGVATLGAMRVLAFATEDNREACETLVDAGGIKSLFRYFMRESWPKKLSKKYHWGPDEWKTMIECVIATIYNCVSLLGFQTLQQLRLWKKFSDEDAAGVTQAARLWQGYKSQFMRKGLMPKGGEEFDGEEYEFLLLKRVEEGYGPLSHLTLILILLVSIPSPLQDVLSAAVERQGLLWADVWGIVEDHKRRSGYDFVEAINPLKGKIFK